MILHVWACSGAEERPLAEGKRNTSKGEALVVPVVGIAHGADVLTPDRRVVPWD